MRGDVSPMLRAEWPIIGVAADGGSISALRGAMRDLVRRDGGEVDFLIGCPRCGQEVVGDVYSLEDSFRDLEVCEGLVLGLTDSLLSMGRVVESVMAMLARKVWLNTSVFGTRYYIELTSAIAYLEERQIWAAASKMLPELRDRTALLMAFAAARQLGTAGDFADKVRGMDACGLGPLGCTVSKSVVACYVYHPNGDTMLQHSVSAAENCMWGMLMQAAPEILGTYKAPQARNHGWCWTGNSNMERSMAHTFLGLQSQVRARATGDVNASSDGIANRTITLQGNWYIAGGEQLSDLLQKKKWIKRGEHASEVEVQSMRWLARCAADLVGDHLLAVSGIQGTAGLDLVNSKTSLDGSSAVVTYTAAAVADYVTTVKGRRGFLSGPSVRSAMQVLGADKGKLANVRGMLTKHLLRVASELLELQSTLGQPAVGRRPESTGGNVGAAEQFRQKMFSGSRNSRRTAMIEYGHEVTERLAVEVAAAMKETGITTMSHEAWAAVRSVGRMLVEAVFSHHGSVLLDVTAKEKPGSNRIGYNPADVVDNRVVAGAGFMFLDVDCQRLEAAPKFALGVVSQVGHIVHGVVTVGTSQSDLVHCIGSFMCVGDLAMLDKLAGALSAKTRASFHIGASELKSMGVPLVMGHSLK